MKRMLTFVLVMVSVATISAAAVATDISVFGMMSFPVGDFGSADIEDNSASGFAKTGFGGGLEFAFPIQASAPGFSIIGQARLVINPVNTDMEKFLTEEMAWLLSDFSEGILELETMKLEIGQYMNIPLLGGVKYEAEMSPGFKLYGKGLLGVNLVRLPKLEYEMTIYNNDSDEYYDASGETNFQNGFSLCFSVGAGFKISDRFELGFEYLNMGEPTVNGDMLVTIEGVSDSQSFEGKQSVSMMALTMGVTF